MPAVSRSQQALFGMALRFKRGEAPDASEEVRRLAESMSEEKLEEYARTKRAGLPKRVEKALELLAEEDTKVSKGVPPNYKQAEATTMTPEALFSILERGAFPELRKGISSDLLTPALVACGEIGVVPPGWLEKAFDPARSQWRDRAKSSHPDETLDAALHQESPPVSDDRWHSKESSAGAFVGSAGTLHLVGNKSEKDDHPVVARNVFGRVGRDGGAFAAEKLTAQGFPRIRRWGAARGEKRALTVAVSHPMTSAQASTVQRIMRHHYAQGHRISLQLPHAWVDGDDALDHWVFQEHAHSQAQVSKAAGRTTKRRVWVRGYVTQSGRHVPGGYAWRKVLIAEGEEPYRLTTVKSSRPDAKGADLAVEVHPAVERASRIKARIAAALPKGATREVGGKLVVAREHQEVAREVVRHAFDQTADRPRGMTFKTEEEFQAWVDSEEGLDYQEAEKDRREEEKGKADEGAEILADLARREKAGRDLASTKRRAEKEAGSFETEWAGEPIRVEALEDIEASVSRAQEQRRLEWEANLAFLEAHSRIVEVETKDKGGNVTGHVRRRAFDSPENRQEALDRYLNANQRRIRDWAIKKAGKMPALGAPGLADLPEDLAQETLQRVMTGFDGYVDADAGTPDEVPYFTFIAWSLRIMDNVWKRAYRDLMRHGGVPKSLDEPDEEAKEGEGNRLASRLAATEDVIRTVITAMQDRALMEVIERAKLTVSQRNVAYWSFCDGASVEEIARAHGVSTEKVWPTWKAAVTRMWPAGLRELVAERDPKLMEALRPLERLNAIHGTAGPAMTPKELAHRSEGEQKIEALKGRLRTLQDRVVVTEEAWLVAGERVRTHWNRLKADVEEAERAGDELDRMELGISGAKGTIRADLVKQKNQARNRHRKLLGDLKVRDAELETLKAARDAAGEVHHRARSAYRAQATELRRVERAVGVPDPAPVRDDWLEAKTQGAKEGTIQLRGFARRIQAQWDKAQGKAKVEDQAKKRPGLKRSA